MLFRSRYELSSAFLLSLLRILMPHPGNSQSLLAFSWCGLWQCTYAFYKELSTALLPVSSLRRPCVPVLHMSHGHLKNPEFFHGYGPKKEGCVHEWYAANNHPEVLQTIALPSY